MSFNLEGDGVRIANAGRKRVFYDEENEDGAKDVTVSDVKLEIIPRELVDDETTHSVFYLSAKAGAGKSVLVSQLLNMYRRGGKKKIFVFAPVKEEIFGDVVYPDINDIIGYSSKYQNALEKYNEAKIKFKYLKKTLKDDPLKLCRLEMRLAKMRPDMSTKGLLEFKVNPAEYFGNGVVVMDDYLDTTVCGAQKLLLMMRDHIITTGRKQNISVLLCHHKTTDGKATGKVLTEVTNLVLFRKSTPCSREYVLKRYLGVSSATYAEIEKRFVENKDRWIMFDKDHGYMMSPHWASVL